MLLCILHAIQGFRISSYNERKCGPAAACKNLNWLFVIFTNIFLYVYISNFKSLRWNSRFFEILRLTTVMECGFVWKNYAENFSYKWYNECILYKIFHFLKLWSTKWTVSSSEWDPEATKLTFLQVYLFLFLSFIIHFYAPIHQTSCFYYDNMHDSRKF